jgi:predicted GNAT superfamily acetyltransferase
MSREQPGAALFPSPRTPSRGDLQAAGQAAVELRRLTTIEEFRQCEALQTRIWGAEDVVRLPSLVMVTAQQNGGFVLGAFAESRLVGFVCASPGLTAAGAPKQCSVLMAVEPAFQSAGIGYRLKLAQRAATLAQGLDLITWTFDPLASLNAHLNLHKLGCVSSVYLPDCYGTAESGLNAGLATDRFVVEWWLRSPEVEARLGGAPANTPETVPETAVLVNEVVREPRSGLPVCRGCDLDRREPVLLVEIPESIRAVKLADMDLARAWRAELRRIFPQYFAQGYQLAGFQLRRHDGAVRPCHVLRRQG